MSERRASDDVRTSEARAIVRRLIDAGEGLPDSVRRDIVDLSDAAVSRLLEILEDASLALGNAPGGGEAPVHAARPLGSLRAARAVEPMLAVLARTDCSPSRDSKTEDRLPVEYELLKDVAALDLEVIETLGDNTHVEIGMKEDPDVLEPCALGLIYASASSRSPTRVRAATPR